MATFLDNYLQIIPASQKKKLLEIIDGTETSVQGYNSTAIKSLLSNTIAKVTKLEKQPEYMSSDVYNKMIQSIYQDLYLLFTYANTTDVSILNNRILDMSDFDILNTELSKLRSKISSLKAKMLSDKTTQVIIDDFSTLSNIESRNDQTKHLFTDRDGSIINDDVTVNTTQKVCSLPINVVTNALRDKYGYLTATVSYVTRSNETSNVIYPIDKVIDGSIESYWSESIEVDEKISYKIDDVTGGALVKFSITLASPKVINEIKITPFSAKPLDIVSITVQNDVQPSSEIIDLDLGSAKIMSSSTTNVIRFKPLTCRKIEIMIRQENYTKTTYSVRESQISSRAAWNTVTKEEVSKVTDNKAWDTFVQYDESLQKKVVK
jgi:hypothetical protein